tara:strand:- start:138 stop:338 length:201 start_codon:yes stop_codon:yes gene_type:complete
MDVDDETRSAFDLAGDEEDAIEENDSIFSFFNIDFGTEDVIGDKEEGPASFAFAVGESFVSIALRC